MNGSELRTSLQKALQVYGWEGVEIFDGFVTAVHDDHTCDVKIFDDDNSIISGIALRSIGDNETTGLIIVPEVGSHAVLAKIEGQDDYTILKTSRITKVIINDANVIINEGKNGGVIIVNKLAAEINKLNDAVNTLRQATAAALVPVDGLAAGTSAGFISATGGIIPADLSDVTNDKVKH